MATGTLEDVVDLLLQLINPASPMCKSFPIDLTLELSPLSSFKSSFPLGTLKFKGQKILSWPSSAQALPKNRNNSTTMVVDGDFMYIHDYRGFLKASTGYGQSKFESTLFYASRGDEKGTLLYVSNKLYFRSSLFQEIDKETLEVSGEISCNFPQSIKLISDGSFLYTITIANNTLEVGKYAIEGNQLVLKDKYTFETQSGNLNFHSNLVMKSETFK